MATARDVGVGIDVAKAQLDIAVEPTGATWTVPRSRGGLRRLPEQRQALRPTRIVLEASGGYERLVVASLAAAGLPVVRVNPRQTHAVARARGRLAKTDRLDAQVLARCAAEVRPPLRRQPSAVVEDLQILSRRRRQRVADRAADQPRRRHAPTHLELGFDPVAAARTAALAQVERQLAALVVGGADAAGARHLAAEHPRDRPRGRRHPAGRHARTGRLLPPADRRPGRGGALQPRQRRPARAAPLLGRPRAGAHRALYGRADGHPPQPPHPRLLPAPARCRQAGQGGPRRLPAQAARDLQRPLPHANHLGPHHALNP